MLVTADQLIVHALGDYVVQSDWMANEKTKKSVAAVAHAASYTVGFLFLTFSWKALLVIGVTHFFIDRFRLARYVCYAKNFLAPPRTENAEHTTVLRWWYRWAECCKTGYHEDRPLFMSVWLLIITDNLMHVVINALALKFL